MNEWMKWWMNEWMNKVKYKEFPVLKYPFSNLIPCFYSIPYNNNNNNNKCYQCVFWKQAVSFQNSLHSDFIYFESK